MKLSGLKGYTEFLGLKLPNLVDKDVLNPKTSTSLTEIFDRVGESQQKITENVLGPYASLIFEPSELKPVLITAPSSPKQPPTDTTDEKALAVLYHPQRKSWKEKVADPLKSKIVSGHHIQRWRGKFSILRNLSSAQKEKLFNHFC